MSDTETGGVSAVDSITTDGSSGLCAVCDDVPFGEMLACDIGYHLDIDRGKDGLYKELGPLADVMKRDSCPLCRLVGRALFPGDGEEQSLDSETLKLKCKIHSSLGGDWILDGPKLEIRLSGSDHRATIKPHHEDYLIWAREMAMRVNIKPYAAREDPPLARPVRKTIDIPLVRSWLDDCENKHSGGCDLDVPSGTESKARSIAPASFPLLLIDVGQKRIVMQDSTARYVTLSYVWGQTGMLKTTQANLASMEVEGALRDRDDVPAVIRDSIDFLELLGEKYLWVDALCIIQDQDREALEECLARMDRIYSLSVFTVVAISGDSADVPLPGVQQGSRPAGPEFESIRGLRCAPTISSLGDVARHSRFATRGWTFQETILSKRRLFFAPNQVFFQCGRGTKSEGESGVKHVDTWDTPPVGNTFSLFECYAELAKQYTMRFLSHESDVCRAFSGMASFLGAPGNTFLNSQATKFVANLPEHYFLNALLWTPGDELERRRGADGYSFPSWSWAGWKGPMGQIGPVSYDWLARFGARMIIEDGIMSCVDARLRTEQGIACVLCPQTTSKRHAGPCSVCQEFSMQSHAGYQVMPLPALPALPLLEICAHQTEVSQFGYGPLRTWGSSDCVHILDASDRHCGILVGASSELSRQKLTEPGNRLMLLGVKGVLKSVDARVLVDEYYMSLGTWCGTPDPLSDVGCIFYVMLVGNRGQVFERLAVGQIHPEAWKEVGSKVESIVLG